MWHIYTMEYYSCIKRNKIVSFAETWTDLETLIQREVSQKEKSKYHMHTCTCCHFNCVQLFVTLWTLAHQAPLSMGFSS